MTNINKPFTIEDLEEFHKSVRELPKIPTRVRVGTGLLDEITKVAIEVLKTKCNKECGFTTTIRATPIVLDKDLSLYEYEVDYN